MATTTLTLDVEYDPTFTDPECLAAALDMVLERALSTGGILDACGDSVVGDFQVPKAHVAEVVTEARNSGMALDRFHSDTEITLERLTEYYEAERDFNWDRDSITVVDSDPESDQFTDLDAWETDREVDDE